VDVEQHVARPDRRSTRSPTRSAVSTALMRQSSSPMAASENRLWSGGMSRRPRDAQLGALRRRTTAWCAPRSPLRVVATSSVGLAVSSAASLLRRPLEKRRASAERQRRGRGRKRAQHRSARAGRAERRSVAMVTRQHARIPDPACWSPIVTIPGPQHGLPSGSVAVRPCEMELCLTGKKSRSAAILGGCQLHRDCACPATPSSR
jgi:hypothetical protein